MAALTFFEQNNIQNNKQEKHMNSKISVTSNDIVKFKSLLASVNKEVVGNLGMDQFYTDLSDTQNIAKVVEEVKDIKNKSLTGSAANSGLGSTRTENKFPFDLARVDITAGDVYRNAGALYLPEQVVGWTGAGITGVGKWTPATSGTPYATDALTTPTISKTINLALYNIKMGIDIWPMLNNYAGNTAQLVAIFEEIAEIQKGVLRDDLISADITGDTNVSGVAANGSSYFPLALTVDSMIRAIRTQGGVRPPKLGIFVNQIGAAKLAAEQDANGNFKNSDNIQMDAFTKFVPVSGETPVSGKIGTMSGVPVYQTESILNTYTVVTNNITAQTGGNNTAIVVADVNSIAGLAGRSEFDDYKLFTGDDLTSNDLNQYVLKGRTIAGGGISMPTKARYHALAV